MSESRGWVHWHPDGYVFDLEDRKVRSMKNAGVFHDLAAAERWVNVCSKTKKSLVELCDIITIEEAERRLAKIKLKKNADHLRSGRAAMPHATEAEALAQQERAIAGKTGPDRLMVPFRVDISRVRTSVRKTSEGHYRAIVAHGCEATAWEAPSAWEAVGRALDAALEQGMIEEPKGPQPHPWKRADGSHIKASWEE